MLLVCVLQYALFLTGRCSRVILLEWLILCFFQERGKGWYHLLSDITSYVSFEMGQFLVSNLGGHRLSVSTDEHSSFHFFIVLASGSLAFSLSFDQGNLSNWLFRPVMSREKKRSQDLKTSLLSHGRGTVSGGPAGFQRVETATRGPVEPHCGLWDFQDVQSSLPVCFSWHQWFLNHLCDFFTTMLPSARCQSPVTS